MLLRPARVALAALAVVGLILTSAVAAGAGEGDSGSTTTTAPVTGDVGVRLVDVPVESVDDPRAQLYIVDHLNPGQTITRRIEVSNLSSAELPIEVYPGPAVLEDGNFIAEEIGEQNDLTTWTTVDPSVVTLPSGASTEVAVTIAVPPDAVEGEQYGAIWAQSPANDAGPVTNINRVGIRIYLSVGPGGAPPSSFEVGAVDGGLEDATGLQVVTVPVTNTGGRALDVIGEVQLESDLTRVGPFNNTSPLSLAPGQSGTLVVPILPPVDPHEWQVSFTVRSGTIEQALDPVALELPAADPSVAEAGADEAAGGTDTDGDGDEAVDTVVQVSGILAVLALLFLVGWGLQTWWTRRHRATHRSAPDPR